MRVLPVFLSLIVAGAAFAQQPTLPLRQSALDARAADAAYRVPVDSTPDARWLGGGATQPRWSVDGEWMYFQFAQDPKPILVGAGADDPWWRVSRDGKKVESVTRAAALEVPAVVRYTRDGTRGVWFSRGALRYWVRGQKEPRVLLQRADAIQPQWSADDREVRWTETNTLWTLDPERGTLRQLTRAFVPKDADKKDKVKDELRKEQLDLFDFVKRGKVDKDSAERLAMTDRAPGPVTTPLKKDDNLSFIDAPAGGLWVTYLVTPKVDNPQTQYGDYVNDSGWVFTRTARPKVGQAIALSRAAIVKADPTATPDSVKAVFVDTAGFGKATIPVQLQWNRQGTRLAVEFQSTDYKDRWITLVDPATGKRTQLLRHDHDDAWFGGTAPAMGWLNPSWMVWLPSGDELAFTSEATGWMHLYAASFDGTTRPLTSGEWEIRSISMARDESRFWIQAGINHPDELHLYALPLAGGVPVRLDELGEGEITPSLSPDEKTLAFRFGTPTELTDIFLQPATPSAKATRVTRSGTDAFYKIQWPASDFVSFPDSRGKPVFARVYRPSTVTANKPAVLEIHGAGYAQGVHKSFAASGAHGGSLNAKVLTDLGVTYLVLDYRGSSGYGRDMRTDVYRSMGTNDVNSATAAVKFLGETYGVNPKKVGLFGCSYGGFFTLMALFKHPGEFQAGAAQCSVTDWAHYNHGYTARILNGAPADDTTSYKTSSPIWHAAGLQDRLLLQHGLVDPNVEYQDAVRLVQRLMELGKDFEFVTYPIEQHGWRTRWAKIDSQRRVMKLWQETILR
ncbi:MAG: prolyl oligopeptidase family serine peptidase [Gemmatimonadetes bacterium]|nr:prolyl oligopeptidase family serine peptidase [Gemmatimonadota bacterium]